MVRVFKWLALVLFAYIITAFLVHPDWSGVIYVTIVPHVKWTREYVSILARPASPNGAARRTRKSA
jgi:hypothetical protein